MTARSSGIAVFCRSDKRHASDTVLVFMLWLSLLENACVFCKGSLLMMGFDLDSAMSTFVV